MTRRCPGRYRASLWGLWYPGEGLVAIPCSLSPTSGHFMASSATRPAALEASGRPLSGPLGRAEVTAGVPQYPSASAHRGPPSARRDARGRAGAPTRRPRRPRVATTAAPQNARACPVAEGSPKLHIPAAGRLRRRPRRLESCENWISHTLSGIPRRAAGRISPKLLSKGAPG